MLEVFADYPAWVGIASTGAVLAATVALAAWWLSTPHTADVSCSVDDRKIVVRAHTVTDVAGHNSRDSCWIVLKGKVYDVTAYVEEHPGGDAILRNAGGDSTTGFYGPQHPPRVFDMIGDYYIGDLQATEMASSANANPKFEAMATTLL